MSLVFDAVDRSPMQNFLASQALIDLSMPIEEHWRFKPAFEPSDTVTEGQPFHSTRLSLGGHAFTHVDAPSHLGAGGPPLGDVDVSRLWGEASIVDLSPLGDDAAIGAAELDAAGGHVREGDIVVLRTDHATRHPTATEEYWTAAPYVAESGARWLAAHGARAVGFDFPQDRATRSPYDPDFVPASGGLHEDWACHSLLLEAGVPQIEYLSNLHSLHSDRVLFFALPLNFPSGDGAPTRAFALIDPTADSSAALPIQSPDRTDTES